MRPLTSPRAGGGAPMLWTLAVLALCLSWGSVGGSVTVSHPVTVIVSSEINRAQVNTALDIAVRAMENDTATNPLTGEEWTWYIPARAFNITLSSVSTGGDAGNATTIMLERSNGKNGPRGVATIGPASSAQSVPSAVVGGVLNQPQISPQATSPTLSDPILFPLFSRVVGPDTAQGSLLLQLVRHFGWRSVALVAAADEYGQGIVREFSARAGLVSVNIPTTVFLSTSRATMNLTAIRAELTRQLFPDVRHLGTPELLSLSAAARGAPTTRVILLAAAPTLAQAVLKVARDMNIAGPGPESSQYVWLGVDGWVRDIFVLDDLSIITPADLPSVRQATVGVLGIFFSTPTSPLRDYFDHQLGKHHATYEAQYGLAAGALSNTSFTSLLYVDAFWVLAKALAAMHNASQAVSDGAAVFAQMKRVQFSGLSGPIQFQTNGDRFGSYDILNFVASGGNNPTVHTVAVASGVNNTSPGVVVWDRAIPVRFADGTTAVPGDGSRVRPSGDDDEAFIIGIAVTATVMLIAIVGLACTFHYRNTVKTLRRENTLLRSNSSARTMDFLSTPLDKVLQDAAQVKEHLTERSWWCSMRGKKEDIEVLDHMIRLLSESSYDNLNTPEALTVSESDDKTSEWLRAEVLPSRSLTIKSRRRMKGLCAASRFLMLRRGQTFSNLQRLKRHKTNSNTYLHLPGLHQVDSPEEILSPLASPSVKDDVKTSAPPPNATAQQPNASAASHQQQNSSGSVLSLQRRALQNGSGHTSGGASSSTDIPPPAAELGRTESEERALHVQLNALQGQSLPPPAFLSPRQLLHSADRMLEDVYKWDFDIFAYADHPDTSHPLVGVAVALLFKCDLLNDLPVDLKTLMALLHGIESGYHRDNPFHNALHGADVAQSAFCCLIETGLVGQLTPAEILAMVLAALAHDYDHPGVNNSFLVNSGHELALRYNDMAVLENHHAAASLSLMRQPGRDVFANFETERRRHFRSLIIDLILATDLKAHYENINQFKRKVAAGKLGSPQTRLAARSKPPSKSPTSNASQRYKVTSHLPATSSDVSVHVHAAIKEDEEESSTEPSRPMRNPSLSLSDPALAPKEKFEWADVMTALKMTIKCSDLSHPAKNWPLHLRWTDAITKEMYNQGDRERKLQLPVSPFMDRRQDHLRAKSQLGFFEFLVVPMWVAFTEQYHVLSKCSLNVSANRKRWQSEASDDQKTSESRGSQ